MPTTVRIKHQHNSFKGKLITKMIINYRINQVAIYHIIAIIAGHRTLGRYDIALSDLFTSCGTCSSTLCRRKKS